MCLIFYLLLLHTCTEIRKSPAVVNWVKACFSFLAPCDSAFFSTPWLVGHTQYLEKDMAEVIRQICPKGTALSSDIKSLMLPPTVFS